MKRWLMTFAFVAGCFVGYSLQGAPFLAAQTRAPNPFSFHGFPPQDSAKPQGESSESEPAAFDPQQELKKRQTMGDILELRQHFGSVVSQDDGQFAQLLGELVEHQTGNETECPLDGVASTVASALAAQPAAAQPTAGVDKVAEPGGQNGNGVVALVPYSATGPTLAGAGQPRLVEWAEYKTPGPLYSYHVSYATPTQHTAIAPGKSPAKSQQIRLAARQLDEVANNLEDLGEYESADRIRQQAQLLRQSCRE